MLCSSMFLSSVVSTTLSRNVHWMDVVTSVMPPPLECFIATQAAQGPNHRSKAGAPKYVIHSLKHETTRSRDWYFRGPNNVGYRNMNGSDSYLDDTPPSTGETVGRCPQESCKNKLDSFMCWRKWFFESCGRVGGSSTQQVKGAKWSFSETFHVRGGLGVSDMPSSASPPKVSWHVFPRPRTCGLRPRKW